MSNIGQVLSGSSIRALAAVGADSGVHDRFSESSSGMISQKNEINDAEYTKYALSQEAWDLRCRQLLEFRARFGHTLVPDDWKTNPSLTKWIREVRRLYAIGQLDREKILQALTIKLDLERSSSDPLQEQDNLKVPVSSFTHRRVSNFWNNSEMRLDSPQSTSTGAVFGELQTESLVKELEITPIAPATVVEAPPALPTHKSSAKQSLAFDPDDTLEPPDDSWIDESDDDHVLGFGTVSRHPISAPASPVHSHRDPIGDILSAHCSLPPPSPKRHAGLISTVPTPSASSSRASLRNSEPNSEMTSNASSSSVSGGSTITFEIGGFGVSRASVTSSASSLSSSAGTETRKKVRALSPTKGTVSSTFTRVGNIRVFTIPSGDKENAVPPPATATSSIPSPSSFVSSLTSSTPSLPTTNILPTSTNVSLRASVPMAQRGQRPIQPVPAKHQPVAGQQQPPILRQSRQTKPSAQGQAPPAAPSLATAAVPIIQNMHPVQYLQMYMQQQPPEQQQALLCQIFAGRLPENFAATVASLAAGQKNHSASSISGTSVDTKQPESRRSQSRGTKPRAPSSRSSQTPGSRKPLKVTTPISAAGSNYDSSNFASQYMQLVDFKRERGHLDIPADTPLGAWLVQIRAHNSLSAEQVRLLQSVGLEDIQLSQQQPDQIIAQTVTSPQLITSPPNQQRQLSHFHTLLPSPSSSAVRLMVPQPSLNIQTTTTTPLPPECPLDEALL